MGPALSAALLAEYEREAAELRLCPWCDVWSPAVAFERVELPLVSELCGFCFEAFERDEEAERALDDDAPFDSCGGCAACMRV